MKKLVKYLCAALSCICIVLNLNGGIAATVSSDGNIFTALPVTYSVTLNGLDYSLQAYNIDGGDYFKLRDIAAVMIGTTRQFQVSWRVADKSIHILQGKVYSRLGGEFETSSGTKSAVLSTSAIYTDGNRASISGYRIDGSHYFTFQDIAEQAGFKVDIDTVSLKAAIYSSPPENYEGENAYSLTLRAGNAEALLNGETRTVDDKPFIDNDIFYVPLQAVTQLLGGVYAFENNRATVSLFGISTVYEIGSRSIEVNGETYEVKGSKIRFNEDRDTMPADNKYVPILVDGTVYIPDQFTGYQCPHNSVLSGLREYPQSDMVILGGMENERGIHEVKLLSTYDILPADFRARLPYAGIAGQVLNYNIEVYRNNDLEIYVMRVNAASDDAEGMDGRICAIKVLGSMYSTPRGLRTGDSAYRAWLLYGYDNLSYSFSYRVNGGTVKSIVFSSRYFAPSH